MKKLLFSFIISAVVFFVLPHTTYAKNKVVIDDIPTFNAADITAYSGNEHMTEYATVMSVISFYNEVPYKDVLEKSNDYTSKTGRLVLNELLEDYNMTVKFLNNKRIIPLEIIGSVESMNPCILSFYDDNIKRLCIVRGYSDEGITVLTTVRQLEQFISWKDLSMYKNLQLIKINPMEVEGCL